MSNLGELKMRKFLTVTVAALALASFGYGYAAVVKAQEAPAVSLAMVPVFPAEKTETKAPVVAPVHATHKIQTGKTARFMACRESRDVRGNQERRCVSWNAKKGWSKSPKWIPAYQLVTAR